MATTLRASQQTTYMGSGERPPERTQHRRFRRLGVEARALTRLPESKARKPVPNLAEWLERTAHETLTFLDHSAPEHRRLLKTTNSMEHDHAEVRRRSRVVRIFANEASLVGLLGALAIERNEQWMERRYMVFKQNPSTNDEEVTQIA
jgi:transposase-like protein